MFAFRLSICRCFHFSSLNSFIALSFIFHSVFFWAILPSLPLLALIFNFSALAPNKKKGAILNDMQRQGNILQRNEYCHKVLPPSLPPSLSLSPWLPCSRG